MTALAPPTAGSGMHVYSTGSEEPSRHRRVVRAAHTGLPVDSTCVTGQVAWVVSGMTSEHVNKSWRIIPLQAVAFHPRRRSASVFKDRMRPAGSTVHMPRGSAWSSAWVAARQASSSIICFVFCFVCCVATTNVSLARVYAGVLYTAHSDRTGSLLSHRYAGEQT